MASFAERTGLTSNRPTRRYLWTDAFAVCNWIGLGEVELALRLVDRVHHVLGRHRPDDVRTGWLSGLGEREGEGHPTRGGLRIGKRLPERRAGEPFDDALEWDRDGQYFHYLTRWMHALDAASRATGQSLFVEWARDLAVAAHAAFVRSPAGGRADHMSWKMSVDLSRPLVPSMGQHDPLDGYLTCLSLDASAAALDRSAAPRLARQAADFAALIGPGLATTDPLGLGGLLVDALRALRLTREAGAGLDDLRRALLAAAGEGLDRLLRGDELHRPATQRLAFRELGLAIGLAALEAMAARERDPAVDPLARFVPVRGAIESFWQHEPHRRTPLWLDHGDINDVMLATSLAPEGYLGTAPA